MLSAASSQVKKKNPKIKSKGTGFPPLLQERLSFITSLFVIAIFSVYNVIVTRGYVNYDQTKNNAFKFLLFAVLIILAICVIHFSYTQPSWKLSSFKQHISSIQNYEWFLIAYILIAFISALFAKNYQVDIPGNAWVGYSGRSEGVFQLTYYVIIFFIVSRLYKPDVREYLIFVVFSAILASYGILQFFGIDPFNLGWVPHTMKYFINVYSTLSNTNAASALLTLCMMISMVLFVQKEDRTRWVFLISLLFIWLTLLLGKTESGLIGMIVSFIIIIPLLIKNKEMISRFFLLIGSLIMVLWIYQCIMQVVVHQENTLGQMFRHYFLWMGLAFLILSFAMFLLRDKIVFSLPDKFKKNWKYGYWLVLIISVILIIILLPSIAKKMPHNTTLQDAAQLSRGEIRDEMGSQRGYIWKKSFELVKENSILGAGPDGFYPSFQETGFNAEANMRFQEIYDKAHSEYIQTLVDLGPFALISLVCFYAILIFYANRYSDDMMVLATAAALLCFLVQALFNFKQMISTPAVWVIWGILGALIRQKNKRKDPTFNI